MRNNHHHNSNANRPAVPYSNLLVERIDLSIRYGETVSVHSLYFDDLTVAEMKRDGFCGPVYLKDADDVIHECELTAVGEDELDGKPLNGLVFKIDCPRESGISGADVIRFSAKKKLPSRKQERALSAARP